MTRFANVNLIYPRSFKVKSSLDLAGLVKSDQDDAGVAKKRTLYQRMVKLDANLLLIPSTEAPKNTPFLLVGISRNADAAGEEPSTPFVSAIHRKSLPEFGFEINDTKPLLVES